MIDSKIYSKIDRLFENLYQKLDQLAPEMVSAREWLDAVEETAGSSEGYENWINEVWEFPDE